MHKPRLARLPWHYTRQPVYFLTLATVDRKKILANAEVHSSSVTFAARAAEHGVYVGRYALMPDHIHLFAAFAPDSVALSDWVKSLKNALSKTLRSQGVPALHWQKGFFDHVLRSEETYAEKWLYVAQNPVRARLVVQPEDWLYQGEIHSLEVRGEDWI
jgi:REP element-mobilizing transposase RayT